MRILLLILIIAAAMGGLIVSNWKEIIRLPKSVLAGAIALVVTVIVLVVYLRFNDDTRSGKGTYRPAYYENGVLKEATVEEHTQ